MAAQWDAKNKNCLITGAAAGLGAAYVEALLKEGAKVIKKDFHWFSTCKKYKIIRLYHHIEQLQCILI